MPANAQNKFAREDGTEDTTRYVVCQRMLEINLPISPLWFTVGVAISQNKQQGFYWVAEGEREAERKDL